MTSWVVEMSGEVSQKFIDLQELSGQYYELKPQIVRTLQKRVKEEPNYFVDTGRIRSVKGFKKRSLEAPFLLILILKSGLTVSLLGELTEDDGGLIIGVWPSQFSAVLNEDAQAVLNLLYIAIEQPQVVQRLDLVF